MGRFFYLIGEGIKNIFKHGFMSFATITIITACLLIMGSVSLLSLNLDQLISDLEDQNEIVAFVDESVSDADAEALQSEISAISNVSEATFVTREEAMENFMGNYDSDLMEGVDASVFRDRYVVHLDDIAKMSETKAALEKVPGIAKVNAHLDYAESFIKVRNILSVVSFVLIIVLLFVSFFIMSNTIKLASYSRREEIGIMKMVGASNAFIRFPYVVEGLILGLLGSVIAYYAMWGFYNLLTGQIITSMTGSLLQVIPFTSVKQYVAVFYLGVGVLVGMFGGVNAIRNYLKV